MGRAIRGEYEAHGVSGYYAAHGDRYRNPHEAIIGRVLGRVVREWHLDLEAVLDLACGSGEATLALRELGARRIEGVDPHTGAAYLERTGQVAAPHRFEEIAAGALAGRCYSLIVCSFALHLLDESWLPALLFHLRAICQPGGKLLIITPHKRPELRPEWGWSCDEELRIERVRARLHSQASHNSPRI